MFLMIDSGVACRTSSGLLLSAHCKTLNMNHPHSMSAGFAGLIGGWVDFTTASAFSDNISFVEVSWDRVGGRPPARATMRGATWASIHPPAMPRQPLCCPLRVHPATSLMPLPPPPVSRPAAHSSGRTRPPCSCCAPSGLQDPAAAQRQRCTPQQQRHAGGRCVGGRQAGGISCSGQRPPRLT